MCPTGGWDPEAEEQNDGEEGPKLFNDGRVLDVVTGHWMPLEVMGGFLMS